MHARWQFADVDNPLELIWSLERTHVGHVLGALCVALSLHGGLAAKSIFSTYDIGAFARTVHSQVVERSRRVVTVNLEHPPEPERPPEAEPKVPERTVLPEPLRQARPKVREAAPAAARAARVLTADPDPDEPIDMTGNAFVQGSADNYAGGVTASKGTSAVAVHDLRALPDGVGQGQGKVAADLSRIASPLDKSWNCPFPPEADVEQINTQRVTVDVKVSTSGKALEAQVVGDPGFGFGPAAKRCALRQRYQPALARDGQPVVDSRRFSVFFSR